MFIMKNMVNSTMYVLQELHTFLKSLKVPL